MPNQPSELKRNDADPHFQSLKPVYVISATNPTDSQGTLRAASTSPTDSSGGATTTRLLGPSQAGEGGGASAACAWPTPNKLARPAPSVATRARIKTPTRLGFRVALSEP